MAASRSSASSCGTARQGGIIHRVRSLYYVLYSIMYLLCIYLFLLWALQRLLLLVYPPHTHTHTYPPFYQATNQEHYRIITLGCKPRGAASDPLFDSTTGLGRVEGVEGDYRDALAPSSAIRQSLDWSRASAASPRSLVPASPRQRERATAPSTAKLASALTLTTRTTRSASPALLCGAMRMAISLLDQVGTARTAASHYRIGLCHNSLSQCFFPWCRP